jgi:hypothetical protein
MRISSSIAAKHSANRVASGTPAEALRRSRTSRILALVGPAVLLPWSTGSKGDRRKWKHLQLKAVLRIFGVRIYFLAAQYELEPMVAIRGVFTSNAYRNTSDLLKLISCNAIRDEHQTAVSRLFAGEAIRN